MNGSKEPALGGGIWYPLTIRRILLNETYTGHSVYRKTHVSSVRDPRTGKKHRKVEMQAETEWIVIEGATPPIVSQEAFRKVQEILTDPARRLRVHPSARCMLRGHIRCSHCGTPMVGQSIQGGRFRYYRCRRSYAGFTDERCEGRYVRATPLETLALEKIADRLADGDWVIRQAIGLNGDEDTAKRLKAVLKSVAEVEAQQKRLARLYTSGLLPESSLTEEGARLNAERQKLEQKRQALEGDQRKTFDIPKLRMELPRVLQAIRALVENAEPDKLELALRALQVQITATPELVEIEGIVPLHTLTGDQSASEDLVTNLHTSA